MDTIRKYLMDEKKESTIILERNIVRFGKHPDIAAEFSEWIRTKCYRTELAVSVEGYTAKKIYEIAPFLNGLGVFNFLIALREQPENAKAQIKAGFPRK